MTDANGTVRHLAVGAGKDGNIYVVNRDNMGKFSSVGNNIWQELDGVLGGGVWATPAYFNFSVYYGPQGGSLRAFSVTNALLSSAADVADFHAVHLSRNLSRSSRRMARRTQLSGRMRTLRPRCSTPTRRANLATELYNSNQAPNGRDQFGAGNKYIAPVVADGKVFVATTNSVAVFGLLP